MAYNQALQDGNVNDAHDPTVGPNLPMTVNNKPQSSDPSLTTTDHLRLLPPPPPPNASSPAGPIFHLIFHPSLRSVRQWDASFTLIILFATK